MIPSICSFPSMQGLRDEVRKNDEKLQVRKSNEYEDGRPVYAYTMYPGDVRR